MTPRVLTGIVMMGMALLGPALCEAKEYIWQDKNGNWNDQTNWLQVCFPGTPCPGSGFPNAPGDVAHFTLDYSADRTITIPSEVQITVGQIHSTSRKAITIEVGGLGLHTYLVLDNGVNAASIRKQGAVALQRFNVHVDTYLRSPLRVEIEEGNVFMRYLGELDGSRTVTKSGTGRLYFDAATTVTGRVTVENGSLYLRSASGPSIRSELVVGDGIGPSVTAEAVLLAPDQIADHVAVRVNADGQFTPTAPDRIGQLRVENGHVTLPDAPVGVTLAVSGLTMTGETIETLDGDNQLVLDGPLSATSSGTQRALISGFGRINMLGTSRTFTVPDGPQPIDLQIDSPIVGTDSAGLTKDGAGTLQFTGMASNTYPGVTRVLGGTLAMERFVILLGDVTVVPGRLEIGGAGPATVTVPPGDFENIADTADVIVKTGGILIGQRQEHIRDLTIEPGGRVILGGASAALWTARSLRMTGGRMTFGNNAGLTLAGDLTAVSVAGESAVIDVERQFFPLLFTGPNRSLFVYDGPEPIDLRIDATTVAESGTLMKQGGGVLQCNWYTAAELHTTVMSGTLLATGTTAAFGVTLEAPARVGGTGTIHAIDAPAGVVAPGPVVGPGRLSSASVVMTTITTFAVDVNGTTAGSGYDQLDVTGPVTLGNATLALTLGFTPPKGAAFTIIQNDGTDPVNGTFGGLAEGATIAVGTREFTISYRGGDGNDVVVTATSEPPALSYFLAEGATGPFFDDDLLIANPNDAAAPVTLTFLQEGGSTIVEHRTLPAQSRLTVHVDQIAGLEATSASVQVTSDNRLPLIVERTMFWDESYYGGHTANAVAQPETKWIFAEGAQGTFDTYVLIANTNATATTATLTFLREGDVPVVKTVPVEAFARKTVYAGDYPELVGRAFGIVVEATVPVIAERSMYFASLPGRLWTGGHANTGIVTPSTSWFHAEGATGGFFNTFILLSNPQDAAAHVELRFLLDTGAVITRQKTIEARQRLTINPAAEGDARLQDAAVSTVVTSDVPIVSERSMYWAGDATPFGEGHNSSGVVTTGTRWGLAEGRIGGPHAFDTFILLANPSTRPAEVTITYLREGGAPIAKTYQVPATSRYNVDVKTVVPELIGSAFGARIEVTNGTPIAVERSLYWNANGIFWAGGSNALAVPLP